MFFKFIKYAGKEPGGFLKYIISYFSLTVVVIIIGSLASMQLKHRFHPTYAEDIKLKHNFTCSPQISESGLKKVVETQDKSLPIKLRYFMLMEVARKKTEPADLFGKIRRFALCANFTKIGIGSVQLNSIGPSGFVVEDLDENEAQLENSVLMKIKKLYPDFPPAIYEEATCLLKNISKRKQLMSDVNNCQENEKVETKQIETTNTNTPNFATAWILITGADQDDLSANHQVKLTRAITGNTKTEVFLVRSWRRIVSFYDDKAAAETALSEFQGALPYAGYIRQVDQWCPELPPKDGQDALERTVENVRYWRCEK
jgi:hypothetical protein